MKRMQGILSLVVLGCVVCAFAITSFAQEEKYSYGEIVTVADDQVVVREFDPETEQVIEVQYAVNPDTELYNVDTVTDFKENDTVEIYYDDSTGAKVAMAIIGEGPLEEMEEEMTEESGTEVPEAESAAATE